MFVFFLNKTCKSFVYHKAYMTPGTGWINISVTIFIFRPVRTVTNGYKFDSIHETAGPL